MKTLWSISYKGFSIKLESLEVELSNLYTDAYFMTIHHMRDRVVYFSHRYFVDFDSYLDECQQQINDRIYRKSQPKDTKSLLDWLTKTINQLKIILEKEHHERVKQFSKIEEEKRIRESIYTCQLCQRKCRKHELFTETTCFNCYFEQLPKRSIDDMYDSDDELDEHPNQSI